MKKALFCALCAISLAAMTTMAGAGPRFGGGGHIGGFRMGGPRMGVFRGGGFGMNRRFGAFGGYGGYANYGGWGGGYGMYGQSYAYCQPWQGVLGYDAYGNLVCILQQ